MSERIHLSPPDVGPAEEAAVLRALRSGWVAPLGPEVDAFEQELAAANGRAHCVALSSGTAGLHLGLLGLGVQPGDVVVTASFTFAATANAVVYAGAEPVFVDCLDDGTVDPDLLARAVADERAAGRRVGAILPVDLLGHVAHHEVLEPLADDLGVPLLSDAAEALGSWRLGRPAGAFGQAAVLSFNGNKVMTTSGGGALLTDDEALAHRTRYLATQARQPVAHYEHTDIGYNYRMSNVLAALGRAQLARLDDMLARRREHRAWYAELFAGVPGVRIFGDRTMPPGSSDNCWLTAVLVDAEFAGFSAQTLRDALAAADIEARPLWKPMHAQPVFAGNRAYVTGCSDALFATGVTLPSGSGLTEEQRSRISDAIAHVPEVARA